MSLPLLVCQTWSRQTGLTNSNAVSWSVYCDLEQATRVAISLSGVLFSLHGFRAERRDPTAKGAPVTDSPRGTELRFEPPGPGSWGLDPVHFPRPATRYWME